MADYILAKETDAYNIGNYNIQVTNDTSAYSNKLCTVNRAWQLGCTVNVVQATGITYSNGNQIVCKDDLGYDQGIVDANQKNILLNINNTTCYNSNGQSQGKFIDLWSNWQDLLRSSISVYIILTNSTYPSPASINWDILPSNTAHLNLNGVVTDVVVNTSWVLYQYYGQAYYISPRLGKTPSNNMYHTELQIYNGDSVDYDVFTINYSSGKGFIGDYYGEGSYYLQVRCGNGNQFIYLMNLPVSTTSCVVSMNVLQPAQDTYVREMWGKPTWSTSSTNS